MPKKQNYDIPPWERSNWEFMHEGQKRYAYEQWLISRVRRGLPIDHDRPSASGSSTGTSSVNEDHVDHEVSDSEEDEDEQGPEETQQHSEPQRLVPYSDSDEGMSSPMQVDSGKRQAAAAQSGGSKKAKKKKKKRYQALEYHLVTCSVILLILDPLPAPSILDTGNITRYRKVHRFFTYGLAYKVIEHENVVCMVTPLAEIPVDRPFLYMTPSEFDLLPDGSRIVHCSVKVIARNPRIAFPTNLSDTELATLNQNKNMITSVGINLKISGINVKPTAFTANAPMETTAIDHKRKFDSIWKSWYGYRNDEADFLTKVPAHQFGQPINLKYYYACVSSSKDKGLHNWGWKCVQSCVSEVDADARTGSVIVDYTYKPTLGFLKIPEVANVDIFPITSTAQNVVQRYNINADKHCNPFMSCDSFSKTPFEPARMEEQLVGAVTPVTNAEASGYNNLIDKADIASAGYNIRFHDTNVQPSLHVGINPTYALSTSSLNSDVTKYTDTQMLFEVVAECSVYSDGLETHYPRATVPNVQVSDMIYMSNVKRNEESSVYKGQYETEQL
ncbi:uncharacterized protein LOC126210278 isoform X2 [Schistocerca nitens]|uniref:uncharacterized protein LOC126210278 isoform X2 n=1 Tax=Schistocerca nitens TaxID=7011 RepID=UPI002117AB5E|nr:uncharacterized protein LOC126210278 isoform X2 [Schistocerca nitens]